MEEILMTKQELIAERAAREARNPRDGSVMQIGPSKSARFKAGADLKKRVNG